MEFLREKPLKLAWQMDFSNNSHDSNHPPSVHDPSSVHQQQYHVRAIKTQSMHDNGDILKNGQK